MPKRQTINRYMTSTGVEGQLQPGSRNQVLVNRLGIAHKSEMDQAEAAALLAVQKRYLSQVTAETVFTAEMLRSMHREWLGDIYVWAGQYRNVEMSKGGFVWPPAHLVGRNMLVVERETLRRCTPCRPGEIGAVASRMAEVQAEILMVHPFREGNGRLARWVSDLMALQAGLPVPYYGFKRAGAGVAGRAYLSAVVQGYSKNYTPLARLLGDALRAALRRETESEAGSRTRRAPSK